MSTTLSFVGFLLPLLFILFLMIIVLTEHFSVEQSLGFSVAISSSMSYSLHVLLSGLFLSALSGG